MVKIVELDAVLKFSHVRRCSGALVRGAGFGGELTLSTEATTSACAYGIHQSLPRISPQGKEMVRMECDVEYFAMDNM
jgi:hypothetical protein